jgi:hypothetical protein
VTPEFLEGPIARDYREILEGAALYEAATLKKPATSGIKCKSDSKRCDVPTGGKACKTGSGCDVPTDSKGCKSGSGCNVPTDSKGCKTGSGCDVQTGGKACKSDRKICKKTDAFHAGVAGWSQPPAPPVA